MTDQEKIQQLLKSAFPHIEAEPRRDLWPLMLRKLHERPVAVPWYDWGLAVALVALLALFPKFIPLLLYHL